MTCWECGVDIDGWTSFNTEHGEVCAGCWMRLGWTCDQCGGYFLSSCEPRNRLNGESLCEPCYDERTEAATLRSEWDGSDTDANVDNGYDEARCTCLACRGARNFIPHADDGRELISSYGYRPTPIFHGTGPLFLGPEIEVEAASVGRAARIATSHLGDLGYLKEDGSITSGFEVVTHPMAYGWAMDNFPWDMLGELESAGCEAADNCGMHVHVSRAGFSGPCHVHRWLKWFYRHESPITKLARRSRSQWAQFDRTARKQAISVAKDAFLTTADRSSRAYMDAERRYYDATDRLQDERYAGRIGTSEFERRVLELRDRFYAESAGRQGSKWGLKLDGQAGYGRYVAVNTLNRDTFELRVFASSLVPREVQAAFGLATASIEWTREIDAHKILTGKALEWPTFVNYVSSHEQYKPLMIEMENRSCAC